MLAHSAHKNKSLFKIFKINAFENLNSQTLWLNLLAQNLYYLCELCSAIRSETNYYLNQNLFKMSQKF